MNFVDSLELFHVSAKEIPCLTGRGAPTGRTEGVPGVLYMDIDTGDLYKCRGGADGGFRWDMQGGSGTIPVKGVDYFTEADKLEIVALVIEALQGKVIQGYVDESGNIIISNLHDGSYTVSYVNKDGSAISIGSLEVDESGEGESAYTNQIPVSTDANGDPFVGENGERGYKTGYRLGLATGEEKAAAGYAVTGFIPARNGDTIRVKNISITSDVNENIMCYDSNRQPINGGTTNYGTTLERLFVTLGSEADGVYTGTLSTTVFLGMGDDLAFIRIGSASITDESIVSIEALEKDEGPTYTNLFVPGGDGFILNGRCSSSGADRTDSPGCIVTNYIKVAQGDVVRVNKEIVTATGVYGGMKLTDGSIVGFLSGNTDYITDLSIVNGITQFTVSNANADYIRLCIVVNWSVELSNDDVAAADVVLTINQEIV